MGNLNDFWKFNGHGLDVQTHGGLYGNKGEPPSNIPRARESAVYAADSNNNLYMFGGITNDNGYLNDLWKFDGENG